MFGMTSSANRVMFCLVKLVGHRADLQQRDEVADAQAAARLDQPLGDRLRAAGDDEALLDE